MKFYTNVFQIGNSMLVRGYDNGKHFEDRETFHPTFYVPSKRKRSKWKTLDGQLVDPVKPGTIKDCREFIDKYSAVQNFNIYGNETVSYTHLTLPTNREV